MTLHITWTCACDTCFDIMTVSRPRKVCPFGNAPIFTDANGERRQVECSVYNYQRVKCDTCDYSDDRGREKNGDACPMCAEVEA